MVPKAKVEFTCGGTAALGMRWARGHRTRRGGIARLQADPRRPRAGHIRTLCLQYLNVFTCVSFKKGLHILFFFFKNLKKVKKMNSSFLLHVCGIHNSNLSEENILHQFKQHGKPGTRRRTLLGSRARSGGPGARTPARRSGNRGWSLASTRSTENKAHTSQESQLCGSRGRANV